ncbi:MAG: cytochrome d ubiquinol oxidase subunit II [Nevskiales bacterium]|nr:cytochrome d ubiquinol oxidase subunit II [Nevskiales bacterium]
MFDYLTLKFAWWILVGVLLIGFTIMDGHDMGVGTLLPFLGRDDTDRRVMINTVAPHWDGNQVWFITAGGAIFAAWPFVYATAFSGLYWALLLVLFALFFRPVGFEYRSKLQDPRWRRLWDGGLVVGSAVPALVFGVAFGNLFLGVPFRFDDSLRAYYDGSFWALLNPFALLCGVVSLSAIALQGATFLSHRTDGQVQARAVRAVSISAVVMMAAFSVAGVVVWRMHGYAVTQIPDIGSVLNPLMKTVAREPGAWLANYRQIPVLWLIPALAYVGAIAAILSARRGRTMTAFVASSLVCAAVILTAGVGLFPFVLPSSIEPSMSLTAWDAVSSRITLEVMLWVTLIFTPLMLAYTAWAYRVMGGKVTRAYIAENSKSLY